MVAKAALRQNVASRIYQAVLDRAVWMDRKRQLVWDLCDWRSDLSFGLFFKIMRLAFQTDAMP